jgi:ABC-type dipeptide/oligopeptide/nickel transport system ATPase component
MNALPLNQSSSAPQNSFGVVLSQESCDILQRLKKINTSYFFRPDKALVNKLKVINPVELTNILKCFFTEMVKEDRITDPVKFLDRLASIIPLKKMQEAVKDDIPDALKEAKDMFAEAKLYIQMSHENTSPSIRARISSILDGIISVIESIITAFGIGDFFKPAESDLHADFKSQKIMMLLSLFSMITTMILPILGAATGGLIIGGALLGIAALSAIWPFIKPKTTHLPANAENWTKQVQNGGSVAQGRKESLDEIANILKMNRHAILVGPSRVGKSLTAKAFVQAIERGDYPELKGKVVFRINTTDIVGQQASFLGGGNNILNKISAAMGRHRDDIILVFDEIHMACKNNEKIADQLKTFLDEGGEFPHVIGITTEEEYNKHVKDNNAFSLRFDRVDIENTSQDETLKILSDTLLRSRSKPLIKDGALDQVYDKSCEVENAPQPATSLKLLKRCINRTEKTQKSPTEKKIIEVSNKILSIRSQAAASRGRKKDSKVQIADLEKQLNELQEALSKEKNELDRLFKTKDLLNRVTKETYSSVLKISTVAQKKLNSKGEKQLNMFLLLHEFLGKSLESHITEKSENLGIKAVIDEALIEEIASA